MEVLFYAVAVLVIAMFWMKFVEWLGWGLTPVLLFIEEKLEKLEKWFSPQNPEKKDRHLQTGDLCPKCEKGHLRMEYHPFHPAFVSDMNIVAPWPFDLICSFCGEVTVGEY